MWVRERNLFAHPQWNMTEQALSPGSQVVFTSLEIHHKDDLTKATLDAGFIVGPGVSKKTSLLVAGDPDVDSSKARKARENGIPVISETEYVATILGGEVQIDFEAPAYVAPSSITDLALPTKRDLTALKLAVKGLRTGISLHALLENEYGTMIVRGPIVYSPLGETWMIGGMPIATKALTPDKSLRLLGTIDGPEFDHDSADLASNRIEHHMWGNFIVYAKPRTIIGTSLGTGPWILLKENS